MRRGGRTPCGSALSQPTAAAPSRPAASTWHHAFSGVLHRHAEGHTYGETRRYCGLHLPARAQLVGFRLVRGLGVRRGGQPAATVVLGGISVVAFFLTHDLARVLSFTGGSLKDSSLGSYGTAAAYIAEEGDWWRIFTGTFLHADLRHLLFNMFVLYLLGRRLEQVIGPVLLAGVYITSLIGGSAGAILTLPAAFAVSASGTVLLLPAAFVVGASGAVYGLVGAAYVVEYLRGGNPWRDGLGSLIIINVIISFLIPGISIGGHLGGLVAGVLAGFAIGDTSRRRHPPTLAERLSNEPIDTRMRRSPVAVWGLLALIAAAAFAGALAAASTWRDPLF
ncbi:MAG: rhomboid family intramembrane serine protease [Acidimicrobiales bacterium]|nr:rhomboid family intramembrane serine protease [Acidimicrobiales bacterium]MYB83025.1 rhomboid family intramembrane serine protease [Acidimicrobiales bacterium]